MALDPPVSGTLGQFNVALSGAADVIAPLSAQIDGLLSAGIGPFQADLNSQLTASLAAKATLSIQVGNPLAALQAAIAAVAQLQANLQAALALPSIDVSIQTELAAQAAIAGALSAKLGAIQVALELAIQAKAAALNVLFNIQASLNAGSVFAFTFSGDTLATTGGQIGSLFVGGLTDPPNSIAPGDNVSGIVILASDPAAAAAIAAIFAT